MPKLIPKPDLQFLESSDQAGFTTARVTAFRRTSPLAIVRELVQNALDASQEAKNSKAVVQFRLDTIKTADIPGIGNYRVTLNKAKNYRKKKSGGKLNPQELMIVDRMEHALNQSELPILVVVDNGIGLRTRTMRALLADGISDKSNTSGGAFGNGHFAVFPISDLRYLLYAAINGSSQIASGHAILAWQSKRSANGYYICDTNRDDEHIYPKKHYDIPTIIRPILEEIKKRYKHGTAVLVPSFNYFCDDDHSSSNFCKTVARAVTCSFFPVINDKKLEVILYDKEKILTSIKYENLEQTLQEFEEEKRLSKDFLSGHKACIAYQTMTKGRLVRIPVLDGVISIYLRTPSLDGRTRANLFRNGMWITNSDKTTGGLPGFRRALGDRQSFDAILLVTAGGAPKFHDLIRNSEGPLHNEIDSKLLPSNSKKEIKEGFGQIWRWLEQNVPKLSTEEYRSPHLLGIPMQAGSLGSSQRAGLFYQGSISTIVKHQPGRGITRGVTEGGTASGRGRNSGRRNTRHVRRIQPNVFDIVAVPTGKNQKTIHIYSHEECENMLLRLTVDENLDSTTDEHVWEKHQASIIEVNCAQASVKIDKSSPGCVRIENLKMGSITTVGVTYEVSQAMGISVSNPTLRVVLERDPEPKG